MNPDLKRLADSLERVELKVGQIDNALRGTTEGKTGYIERLKRVEGFVKTSKWAAGAIGTAAIAYLSKHFFGV